MELAARGRRNQGGREGHPNYVDPKNDLEGERARVRQWDIKHQHRPGFDLGNAGGRFTELDRAFTAHQLLALLVNEPDSHRMRADFGPAAFDPKD